MNTPIATDFAAIAAGMKQTPPSAAAEEDAELLRLGALFEQTWDDESLAWIEFDEDEGPLLKRSAPLWTRSCALQPQHCAAFW